MNSYGVAGRFRIQQRYLYSNQSYPFRDVQVFVVDSLLNSDDIARAWQEIVVARKMKTISKPSICPLCFMNYPLPFVGTIIQIKTLLLKLKVVYKTPERAGSGGFRSDLINNSLSVLVDTKD